jgi:hypothetical protein
MTGPGACPAGSTVVVPGLSLFEQQGARHHPADAQDAMRLY